jgi:hypothetical protein
MRANPSLLIKFVDQILEVPFIPFRTYELVNMSFTTITRKVCCNLNSAVQG